jgi:Na+/H+ antiporter NhaC
VLLGSIIIGLWWTGSAELATQNAALREQGQPQIAMSFYGVLANSSSNQVLLISSFLASVAAVASSVVSRTTTLEQSMEGWIDGVRSMLLAVVILVLAWSIATLCDVDHLNTAGFLVEITHGVLSVRWMPALAFLLAAVVSFATGSSWSTMGLLMPLTISLTYYLLLDLNEAEPNHHLLLGAIGGVLAGAIFGDHCSPISDTTVLSSAATDCDHLDHVATQIPYAASVAAVALVLGYIPVGFGYSPIILLPLGLIVLFLIVQFVGRPCETTAESPTGTAGSEGPPDLGDIESMLDDSD